MNAIKMALVVVTALATIVCAGDATADKGGEIIRRNSPLGSSSGPSRVDEASNGSRLTAGEVKTLLAAHNRARAEVGVGPLVWSKTLATYAQSWADHLASTSCRMEHRPHSGKWRQVHGENLCIGAIGHHGVLDALRTWEGEKSIYRGEPLSPSNWYPSGHYTQMVWRNTRELGCAKAECQGSVMIVCNYDPPGNVLGQKPY